MSSTRSLLVTVTAICLLAARPFAQSKPAPTAADFGRWETLTTGAPRGALSPDGAWLAYGVNRSNRDNELRLTKLADGTTKVAAFGTQAVFSADSKWVAYAIGYSEAQEAKLRKEKKPVHRKLGLLSLSTGDTTTIDGIESFAFDASGTHLAMRRYAPERPAGRDESSTTDEGDDPKGATLIVRTLATGRDMTFGNVAEYAWQDKGSLLALAVNGDDKTGNGVQLLDTASGVLRVLDSSTSVYTGLAWRKDGDDLAVLRSKSVGGRADPAEMILAWTALGGIASPLHQFDPTEASSFSPDVRISPFRTPEWSRDGRIVFVGTSKWPRKAPDAEAAGTSSSAGKTEAKDANKDEEEPASVDVWHSHDVDVMPKQKVGARNDRRRTLLATWHLEANRFTPLGISLDESVEPIARTNRAYVANWASSAMDRSIGRRMADVSLVDLTTGSRTKLKDRIDDAYLRVSPGGRYLLFFDADHYWTIDLETNAVANITKNLPTSFVNRESDATRRQKPPYGVAGWIANDRAVWLYDRFDIWQVAPDGASAVKLTDGATDQVQHRYVRLDPEEEYIDRDKAVYVSLSGIWSKKSGYGRLRPGDATDQHLVLLDKSVSRLTRARQADVFAYVAQAFDDSPDYFVGGPDLKDPKQATATNSFQQQFAWGKSELIEYRSERGDRLQGVLAYPANYEPGKRYPAIVYVYEKLSDGLHQYVSPSEREPYNVSAFTANGYVVLQPDIIFRPREPGLSVVDCVGAAVRKAVQMGIVDPKRVGIVGHSWGGFDTTFLATHTDMFAAAVAGAPITDLVSNYGNHHWSSGIAETDHIETGQQRMEVPLYEDLQAYIRNSAVFAVHTMKTPLLIEVGDNDGTVFWHQGVELYNIARRAKKEVVLLVYAGEDHGLRKKANQLDYHRRILEWFGHYLKDEPAHPWITNGVKYLERQDELKQATRKATSNN